MFRLAFQTLRYRKASFLGAFMALFLGVAIIMACGGLMETGIRLNAPPERLNTPIVISSKLESGEKARLESKLLEQVASVKGVKQAIADVSFAVELAGDGSQSSDLFGHPWSSASLTPFRLTAGNQPTSDTQVVLDEATAKKTNTRVGDAVNLLVKGSLQTFTVSGLVAPADTYHSPAFFFAEEYGRKQLDAQQVDAIGVIPTAGTNVSQLQQELETTLATKDVRVLSGDERGLAEYAGMGGAAEVLIAGSAPFGGNTIVVVGFVVASILGLSIRQRSREMALLQTIGATPGQVRRMVVVEVMAIAILATGLAFILGMWLGEAMLQALKSVGLVPEQVVFYQGSIPTLIGVAVGLISAFVASLIAARHATRVRPIEALAEVTSQQRWFNWARLVFAIIGLAGGIALGLVTALVMRGAVAGSTSGPAVLPWLLAFGLMAPALIIPGLVLLRRPLQLFGHGTGYLAVKNTRIRYLQSASIVTPIMLASAMALSMLYQQTTLNDMSQRSYTQDIHADLIVTAEGSGISPETARAIGELPGVTASSPLMLSEARFPQHSPDPEEDDNDEDAFLLQGIDGKQGKAIFSYPITAGSLDALQGQTIALSQKTANQLGHAVGESVLVRMGDGRENMLRLVATFESPAGFESGLVPAELLARHTDSGLVSTIAIRSSLSNEAITRELETIIPQQSFVVSDAGRLSDNAGSQASIQSWINILFTTMVTVYALLFLMNTLLITITARKREFALQRLIGSTRREILGMVTLEAASLSFIGIIGGAVVSCISLVPFSIAINGTPFPRGSWMILIWVILGGFLLNIVITLLAAMAALRDSPIKAAANRE